jgi:hypothetical protein
VRCCGGGSVDPADDDICRYVVRYYALDPDRHERRHRIVAAFDEVREAKGFFDNASRELQGRRDRGESVEPFEHYTGVTLEPGNSRRQRDARILSDAIRRGVRIDPGTLDLPRNAVHSATARASRRRRRPPLWP